jgi:hypothetical protein
VYSMRNEDTNFYKSLFSFEVQDFDDGIKYLGFYLKPNCYKKYDWHWLIAKLEKCLKCWSFHWLSRVGRLTLAKSVLEAIHVYWMSLAWIPKGILEKLRRICFKFIWSGSHDKHTSPWARWENLARPKSLGGWGLKNIFLFSKYLSENMGGDFYLSPTYGKRLYPISTYNLRPWKTGFEILKNKAQIVLLFGKLW